MGPCNEAENIVTGPEFALRGSPPEAISIGPHPRGALDSQAHDMHRQFVDSFGFSWQVWEIDAAGYAARGGHAAGWLYFFSRGTTRRLASFPADWDSRSWLDLEEMCMRAEIVGAERTTRLVRRLVATPAAAAI